MKSMKKMGSLAIFFALIATALLSGCGAKLKAGNAIDYGDAESFEDALNEGENLEGKVVRFIAKELHPDSPLGYNVWAGEHLNFISKRNPDIKAGDTVVVRTETIENTLGSWVITYKKVKKAKETDATIASSGKTTEPDPGLNGQEDADSPQPQAEETSDAAVTEEKAEVKENRKPEKPVSYNNASSFSLGSSGDEEGSQEELPLELKEYGWYKEDTSFGDTVYVDYCGMVHNPNEVLIAEYPKLIVTIRNGDGSIMATDESEGGIIMPGDTVPIIGSFSMATSDLAEDAQIIFETECHEFGRSNSLYKNVKCSEFSFTNVSERTSDGENYVTGEIANNSATDLDSVMLSVILRNEGKIVYMEYDYVSGLKAGQSKPFQITSFDDWPVHDTIECYAQPW